MIGINADISLFMLLLSAHRYIVSFSSGYDKLQLQFSVAT